MGKSPLRVRLGAASHVVLCVWLGACWPDPHDHGDHHHDAAEDHNAWKLLRVADPASMLAVWGTSASDVWIVGSRATATGGPTILHYDGAAWSRVESGQSSLD